MAKRRLGVLAVVFCLMFGAVVAKLADVQVVNPDRYVSQGQRQRFVSNVIPAGRGSIVDRNGIELALSIPQKTVFADPALVDDPGRTARKLAPVLGLDGGDLVRRLTRPGRYVVLAHTVADDVARDVAALGLPGIAMFDEFKRYQPSGDVARSLLGRVSEDGSLGYSGLEAQFEPVLGGASGKVTYERSGGDGDRTIAGGRQRVVPARPGRDVVLTLDRAMQFETEQVLARHVATARAKGGIAIVMRPGTGEILAMANVATDPAAIPGDPAGVRSTSNNLALTTVYEPGSVNKVITLAGAIEEGVVRPDTTIAVPDNIQVADHRFTDHDPHPVTTWTTTDILATSSNVGTIMVAQQLGKDGIDSYLRKFGFGAASGLDFPNEASDQMLDPADWSGTSIGAIPIGQGISVTALQMLNAYNVLANDGVLVAPRLIDATGTPTGRQRRPPSARSRVVSASTATAVRAMMAQVVERGTGEKAAVPGYSVAGKTGTARKPLADHMPGNGYLDRDGAYHYVATFAGFLPAEKPELSVIVVLDEPTSSIYASDVAAPAFSELARYALRRYGIPPAAVKAAAYGVPQISASAQAIADDAVPGSGPPTTVPTPSTTVPPPVTPSTTVPPDRETSTTAPSGRP